MSKEKRIEDRVEFEALTYDLVGGPRDELLTCEDIKEHVLAGGFDYYGAIHPDGIEVTLYRRQARDPKALDSFCDSMAESAIEELAERAIVSWDDGDIALEHELDRAFRAVTQRILRSHVPWGCEPIATRHYSAREIAQIAVAASPETMSDEVHRIAMEDDS